MMTYERRLFWTKAIRNTHRDTGRLDTLQSEYCDLRPQTPRHVAKVISSHERSPAVLSAITFDRDKILDA